MNKFLLAALAVAGLGANAFVAQPSRTRYVSGTRLPDPPRPRRYKAPKVRPASKAARRMAKASVW